MTGRKPSVTPPAAVRQPASTISASAPVPVKATSKHSLTKVQIAALKQRLERASQSLHHLPRQPGERPDGVRSAWPELAYASRWATPKTSNSWQPTPAEIDDMALLLDAVMTLGPMLRQLVWARANRVPWQMLQRRFNRSRSHLFLLHIRALNLISDALPAAKI